MVMEYEDNQLVERFLAGDGAAFEVLVRKYLKPLYRFVFSLVGDAQTAEDIVQETFIKTWKRASTFDRHKHFKTWIYTIARNTAVDFLKKKKNIQFFTPLYQL